MSLSFRFQPIHRSDDEENATYNIEEAKVRLQQTDKTDKEAYRAMVKQKHKVRQKRHSTDFIKKILVFRNVD